MFEDAFYAQNRYGSARWSDENNIRKAGLFDPKGLQLGFFKDKTLRMPGDAPLITIAGAGAGKFTTVIAANLCMDPQTPMMVLDPRAEIAATSLHTLARAGTYGYCWCPVAMHHLPQHSCNLLDILTPQSPTLKPDTAMIFSTLIPIGPNTREPYFKQRVQQWCSALTLFEIHRKGFATLPGLYRQFQKIEGDPQAWADTLSGMLQSHEPDIRASAGEMLTKQQDAPREFGAITGEFQASMGFLNDPCLQTALEGEGFSVKALAHPLQTSRIFLNVPAEYIKLWAPVLRLFFALAMVYKRRAPLSPRILLMIDEAGQLGYFEELLKAFTFGRGDGVRTWAFFQDVGQITRNFGPDAVQSFLGSAQVRQFFGARDYPTAKLISDMLGHQTLHFDDHLQQSDARRRRQKLLQVVMKGEDPFEAATDFGQADFATTYQSQQSRALLNPDEVLALPEDKQILFISGKNLHPVLGERKPYFMRADMAGLYLNNPMHPPADSVRIKTRFGHKTLKVCEGPVSQDYAHLPQYQTGRMRWAEGYPV
ncbi:type IV secretory system conjugative DNA transfer family protein [Woodsholea maritima]|uniref:type IV secretory system conjugative DNA transfer family protein n=1 Tax=Woodsholea maritima TaxID=240237 RepID=UPI00038058BE|nr:type IV secretory system conjugative DNA transfer family protein [Woodsholea maritima]